MKAIRDKINEERIKSTKLANLALCLDYDMAQEIRKEQQKHFDKQNFFKKLNIAIEREKTREEEEKHEEV